MAIGNYPVASPPVGIPPVREVESATLEAYIRDAHSRTRELVDDLTDEQLMGPRLRIVNPMRWEIGHVAWFHEHFILQRAYGELPLLAGGHRLYDSIAIHHHERWDLPLPSRSETLAYMQRVHDRLLERLDGGLASAVDSYLYQFTSFHEDMHDEAFTWTRQTLAYPRPQFAAAADPGPPPDARAGALPGDVSVPGGELLMGAPGDAPFVFDNEKWSHPVEVRPFRIARAPVTNAEFAKFVDDGGYARREHWTDAGWRWRESERAEHPVYWQRDGEGGWLMREFDETLPLAPDRPVIHVNWYEASAWCRWAGRRLPREREWRRPPSASPPRTVRPLPRRSGAIPGAARPRSPPAPTWTAGPSSASTSRRCRPATAPSAAARCSATSGSGAPTPSAPTPASPRTPTRSTRRPCSATPGCCAAAPGRPARG